MLNWLMNSESLEPEQPRNDEHIDQATLARLEQAVTSLTADLKATQIENQTIRQRLDQLEAREVGDTTGMIKNVDSMMSQWLLVDGKEVVSFIVACEKMAARGTIFQSQDEAKAELARYGVQGHEDGQVRAESDFLLRQRQV